MPSRALAPAGKARPRLRDHGNPCTGRSALRAPHRHPNPARFARPRHALLAPARLAGPVQFGEHGLFFLG